jgi:hypothetical protein
MVGMKLWVKVPSENLCKRQLLPTPELERPGEKEAREDGRDRSDDGIPCRKSLDFSTWMQMQGGAREEEKEDGTAVPYEQHLQRVFRILAIRHFQPQILSKSIMLSIRLSIAVLR